MAGGDFTLEEEALSFLFLAGGSDFELRGRLTAELSSLNESLAGS